MMANREASTLFAADGDLVLLDQFANVLEADGSFVQLDPVVPGQGVDHVGGGYGFSHSILPAAALHQIIEEKGDDVIRLEESSVLIDDAEASGVHVRSDADLRIGFANLPAEVFEQMIVRLRRMSAEEHVTIVVDSRHVHAGVAQQRVGISARRSPEWIKHHT